MSAFQISITPSRVKNNKKRDEILEPTDVIMAPFTGKVIVQFEDVPVTKTAKRLLRIINPTDSDIEVKVTKSVKPDNNLSVEWMQHLVPAQNQVPMELIWTPDMEIACRDSIQLTDDRNFRKDVMIILKSKSNKPMPKFVKKYPTITSSATTHVTTLRLKSPTGNNTANKRANKPRKSLTQKPSEAKRQWNSAPLKTHNKAIKKESPKINNLKSPVYSESTKENISPSTPQNALMSYIDKLNFTPLTITKSDPCANIDNLSSLPTPDCNSYARPRKLLHQAVEEEVLEKTLILPNITVTLPNDTFEELAAGTTPLTNKTFDVIKRSNTFESLECSPEDSLVIMNKTTVLGVAPVPRALDIIEEEETTSSRFNLQKTFDKISTEDLKRDIHLIGAPLVKQCESMKELTYKSPSNKLGTQGSLPNLNEMEQIRSIEQNRYFYGSHKRMSVIPEQAASLVEEDNLQASHLSVISPVESSLFVQSEICAQSSRFNVHEVGYNSRRNSLAAFEVQFKQPFSAKGKQSVHGSKQQEELSYSDTNSNDSLSSVSSIKTGNIRKKVALHISPPKRVRVDANQSLNASVGSVKNSSKTWCFTQPKKLKLVRKTTPKKEQPRVRLYDSDLYMQTCINPDPFAASTTCDPFLASTMYLDPQAVEKHLTDFRKWLNALVSIPAELDADCNAKIDVGKLFNEVRHKDLTLAVNKETQSLNYHTKSRLDCLRRTAVELFLSEEMRIPCSKVAVKVNKGALSIRQDRNLHLDVVKQRDILELLLYFHPLWLRLGLEVVYGEQIPLTSNSDIYGLTSFIINRLFRDKYLEQKYSRAYSLSEEYAEHIKKFTLQKILFLLLFLDKAKEKRLVKHNPCLFVTKSPFKETREILLRISSELLANLGDITRELKRLGYVLQHKQTFLDEYDYAFKNIAVDLRDGIRLTRIMEIILLRDDLTKQLRAPPISRLQRIHNVNLALRALAEADFALKGEINAASIVDGHREKTLSLLWQIIYKFRSPKFHAAATTLQRWWRRCYLRVLIKRRIREKAELRRIKAVTKLQAVFRAILARKYVREYRKKRTLAAINIQRFVRGFLTRRRQQKLLKYTMKLQAKYRARKLARQQRSVFLKQREAAICLQRRYRQIRLANRLLQVAAWWREQRLKKRQAAATCIQNYWRQYCIMRNVRNAYVTNRNLIVKLQLKWRAKKQMQQQLAHYKQQRQAIIKLQRRYRGLLLMRKQRLAYENLRACACQLQARWRAKLMRRQAQNAYIKLRQAAIKIQQRWRANCAMKAQRAAYLKDYKSICALQQRWRAILMMRQQRRNYERSRTLILWLQHKWQAKLQARQVRSEFLRLKQNVVKMQRRFRATQLMRQQMVKYAQQRACIINMQRRYRNKLRMRQECQQYQHLRQAAQVLQAHWRAYKKMRFQRAKFQGTRAAVLCLQEHLRGYLLMKQQRQQFLRQKKLIVWTQQRFQATIKMRQVKKAYLEKRVYIIAIQQRFRAKLLMRQQRGTYLQQRQAAIYLQRRYRDLLQMRQQRAAWQKYRQCVLTVQTKWRAKLEARKQRKQYLQQLQLIVKLQQRWRATLLMRQQRQEYITLRQACLTLQTRYRARLQMLHTQSQYLLIRSLVICLQRKYRARRLMQPQRAAFLQLRQYTIRLQQKWRGKRLMLQARNNYVALRRETIKFQAQARGYLARRRFQAMLTPEMMELRRQKKAAKIIQRVWRGYRVRRRMSSVRLQQIRHNIAQLKQSTNLINSIRFKVQDSVRLLRGRFNASEALQVLIRLERLSRMVPHLIMWESSFISTFCYGIMAQAIRSEVDKQLIEHCSRIILNLARYNSTTANTFQKGGLVTIAQILLRWCDKDSDIFNTLCTLIWIFSHCDKKRKVIREFMTTTPETIYMVRETKKLVARKEKMKQNVRRPTREVLHQQQHFHAHALPSLEPDYGVIRGKPYIFISSVFAFDTILSQLGIESH